MLLIGKSKVLDSLSPSPLSLLWDSISVKHPQLKRGEEVLVTRARAHISFSLPAKFQGATVSPSFGAFPHRDAVPRTPATDKKRQRPWCLLVCRHSSFHCCTSMQMLPHISPPAHLLPQHQNHSFASHLSSVLSVFLLVYCLLVLSFILSSPRNWISRSRKSAASCRVEE